MKQWARLALCLLATAFTAHAVDTVILEKDFSTYSDGDINGVDGWVAATNGFTVVGGELQLPLTMSSRVMNAGSGTSLAAGERIRITLDYRLSVGPTRKHGHFFGFGVQTNATAPVVGGIGSADMVDAYVFNFALEPSFRYSGQITFMPDRAQWNLYTGTLLADPDCGFNPYGYYTNVVPYDSAAYIDSDSDVLRTVYTITKTQSSNLFYVTMLTTNATTGASVTASASNVSRAGAWSSPSLWFTLNNVKEDGYTNHIQYVKMEKLDPVVAAPTGVSALALDGEVQLAWNLMPGATYDVYRSTTSGVYGAPLVTDLTTESYLDTPVSNGTTYYYVVVAKYSNGDSGFSDEASGTPQTIYVDQLVYSTDFSGIALGDLAADADWAQISGSSNHAFEVISNGASNVADTAVVESYFTNTVGNAVYLEKLFRNNQDDAVEGYIDVVVSVTANGAADSDHTNQGVLGFGLTSSTSESLLTSKAAMALLHVTVRNENNIAILFGQDGNDDSGNRLAYLSWSELNWNPKPIMATTNLNVGSSALPRDLETDPIRISWKIRKTREAGKFQAWASMSNLLTAAHNDGSPVEIASATVSGKTAAYDTPASLFAMGHYYKSNLAGRYSTLHATVSEVSLSHTSGNEPVVKAPTVTSVLAGDREVTVSWSPVLDAEGYTLTLQTTNGETYVVADNITATTKTDSPRWNDIPNTYTLTANFGEDLSPNTASTNFVASPVGLVPAYHLNQQFGGTARTTTVAIATSGATMMYRNAMTTPFFQNGVDGYTGPTIYGMQQVWDNELGTKSAYDLCKLEIVNNYAGWHLNSSDPSSGWQTGPYGAFLGFITAPDMGYSTFDATATTLYIKARWQGWSIGNAGSVDNACRIAIRNGTTWYVSNEKYSNGGNGADLRTVTVADVANSLWRPLTVNPTAEMTFGAAVAGSTLSLTDVNAIGWFHNKQWGSAMYELDVKVQGALPSYDYWVGKQGAAFTNSAPTLDPDNDGVINQWEYAFGGNPLSANTADLPSIVIDPDAPDFVTCIYKKQRDPVSGITYGLKSTDDLLYGSWGNAGTTSEGVIDYYWKAVTNKVSSSIAAEFFKVEVSGP